MKLTGLWRSFKGGNKPLLRRRCNGRKRKDIDYETRVQNMDEKTKADATDKA
jgi:hypothetical protein